jgi:hypothetical protein
VGVLAPTVFSALLAVGNAVLWLTLTAVALTALPVVRHAARGLPAACLRARPDETSAERRDGP